MRTEPMLPALPADLPWTLNAYLLLDGVSVTELPRKLYQWSDAPTFEPLYRDSRWQELLDLSPCLVALDGRQDPILQAFLDNAAQEWGYLLFARVSLPILSQHLRDLLCVQSPHGEPVLLRLADPAVMHSLLEHERMELFGPIEQACAPDALEIRWWQHRRSGSAIARDRTQPYRLSEAEFDALGEVSFRQTLMDMDRHMNLYFPAIARPCAAESASSTCVCWPSRPTVVGCARRGTSCSTPISSATWARMRWTRTRTSPCCSMVPPANPRRSGWPLRPSWRSVAPPRQKGCIHDCAGHTPARQRQPGGKRSLVQR